MYSAVVCRITNIRKHPNADRLNLASAQGNQVVVGLDIKEGDLGIFFPTDGQLSDTFCHHADLYPRFDEQGRRIGGGFFDPKNRRVRAQNFRGEKSEGFWCPLSHLRGMIFDETVANLNEGTQFTELDKVVICGKYETEATKVAAARAQMSGATKKHVLFKEHLDSKQFTYEKGKIPSGSVIHLSEKLHGTSARYGFFREEQKMSWLAKWFMILATWFQAKVWNRNPIWTQTKLLVGSRRVQLKTPNSETSFYGDETFRFRVAEKLRPNILLGETIYGELVGYQKPGSPIMASVSTASLNDKKFQKEYGPSITYKYGCLDGVSQFYIYRITQTNDDGHVVELSVPQVKARCKVLDIPYVPEFGGAVAYNGNKEDLGHLVESLLDGSSILDSSHIREGVIVRVDTPNGETYFLKAKSFAFKVLEGILKDAVDYIDTEESA